MIERSLRVNFRGACVARGARGNKDQSDSAAWYWKLTSRYFIYEFTTLSACHLHTRRHFDVSVKRPLKLLGRRYLDFWFVFFIWGKSTLCQSSPASLLVEKTLRGCSYSMTVKHKSSSKKKGKKNEIITGHDEYFVGGLVWPFQSKLAFFSPFTFVCFIIEVNSCNWVENFWIYICQKFWWFRVQQIQIILWCWKLLSCEARLVTNCRSCQFGRSPLLVEVNNVGLR